MPELPEVENYRLYFNETSLNQKVTAISECDSKVLAVTPEAIEEALVGHHFTHTDRIGKYMFAHSSSGQILHLHFGMTGDLGYFHDPSLQPRFTRFLIHFENGYHLSYIDPRKFGNIDLLEDIETYRTAKKIGVDATQITKEAFVQSFARRKGPIKPVLLQQKDYAGVGNWIADEMLFQAKVHPEAKCPTVSQEKLELLYDAMQDILQKAIKRNTNYGNYAPEFFANQRIDDGLCPIHNCAVERLVVGGRGTYICPQCQAL